MATARVSASPGPGSCPVCERASITLVCVCGYDFETHDPRVAIMRLETEVRAGNKWWLRGFALLITLPFWFMVPSTVGGLLAAVQLCLSVFAIAYGLRRADVAKGQLVAAKQRMALPEARVIQPSHPKARS